MCHLNASPNKQQEPFYLHLSLKMHTHSTTSACFSLMISSVQLPRIPIDMRTYKVYMYGKRRRENGQICLLRSYMCFLVRLYIWEFMESLQSRCTGTQTLKGALCIRFQLIYHFAALSKSRGFAIFHAQKVMKERGITCLQMRFGGISLSL
jgi:hypothetical protein